MIGNAILTDKLQLTGQNLGRAFNSRSGCLRAVQFSSFDAKLANLELKTQPQQLLCYVIYL